MSTVGLSVAIAAGVLMATVVLIALLDHFIDDTPPRTVYSECDGTTLIYTTNQGVAIARNSAACGGTEP